jgi:hypothetical protein
MAKMEISKQHQKEQEPKQLTSTITLFFSDFKIGTLVGRSGIKKLRGASPLALFSAIFTLPFVGNNFYRGIVANNSLGFKKDAAYELLKNPRYNWRTLMLRLAVKLVSRLQSAHG